MARILYVVPMKAKVRMEPRLSKNCLAGIKYPEL